MADTNAVYHQSSFLGGEWSPLAQGRSDDPMYHKAMNACLNAIVTEEGAWVRRSGTQTVCPTRGRAVAKLLPFISGVTENTYNLEFTAGVLRLQFGTGPVFTNDRQVITASSSAAGVISVTTTTNHGWAADDQLVVYIPLPTTFALSTGALLAKRYLKVITTPAANQLTLKDDLGTAFPFDISSGGLNGCTLFRTLGFGGQPWTTPSLIRVVQTDSNNGLILSSEIAPKILNVTVTSGAADKSETFALSAASFVDGPYLDPQTDSLTVSGYSGSITITPGSYAFTSEDVGRHVRILTEPAAWNSATTYSYGNTVKYNGQYWRSVAQGTYASSNVNIVPGTIPPLAAGTSLPLWFPAPEAAQWAWGKITAQAGSTATVLLVTNLLSANGATAAQWRLGLFSAGANDVRAGYPTCGVYANGRLWLAGAADNRFDASMSNTPLTFSPTDVNGQVADNHAIAEVFNSDDLNTINWMKPDQAGILCGTTGGEWLLSSPSKVFTPTSISAERVTNYKMKAVEPVRAGSALVAVQKLGRRIFEYLADAFSGRFIGRHLNEYAKHLAENGEVAELTYMEDRVPVVWARHGDFSLVGCTYRRLSRFVTDAPIFQAWHRHQITTDALDVQSVSATSYVDNNSVSSGQLYLCVQDTNGDCWIEQMRYLQTTLTSSYTAWMCDRAPGRGMEIYPSGAAPLGYLGHLALMIGSGGVYTGVRFYGYYHLAGQTVSASVCGMDLGDFTVDAKGYVDIPFGTYGTGSFTQALIAGFGTSDWQEGTTTLLGRVLTDTSAFSSTSQGVTFPAVIGKAYTSQGQLLRPVSQDDTKSRTGAALAKPRRVHEIGMLLVNTGIFSTGTDTSNLLTEYPLQDDGTLFDPQASPPSLYSGVHWSMIQDDFTRNGMVCWQVTRPWPVIVAAVSALLHGEDL